MLASASYGLPVFSSTAASDSNHSRSGSLQVTNMGAVPWYRKWPFEPWSFCDRVIGTALPSNQRWSWLLLAAPGCFWLLLAASGHSWLRLAAPCYAWRLLATPLAATIHASTDSWGRNFHMTQNISLITVFGHCAHARLGQRERANYNRGRLRKAWACTFKSTLLSTSCHLQQPALLKRLKGRP